MRCTRLQAIMAVLALSMGCALAAPQTGPGPQATASGQVQFPEIPLRRDGATGESGAGSVAWALLFLAVVAGVGFALVRKGGTAGSRTGSGWLRAGAAAGAPKSLGRTALTQQASVHVIEWKGEELLLGCTSHSVALLARAPAASSALRKLGDGAEAGS